MLKSSSLDTARLGETVAQLVEDHHLPGVAIGVILGDDLVYSEGFGYADIESGAPMTPDHCQRIGSVTKTMIGLCAMALVDEGRLSLEDPVADHLPDVAFHGDGDALTIWHLLTHTGGIGETPMPEDLATPFTYLFSKDHAKMALPEAYPRGITLEVPPGTKWAYANHGYVLMGEIIARIEKAPIEDVVRWRVMDPLGMANSDLRDEPHTGLSAGYHHLPPEDDREAMIRMGMASADDVVVDGYNARGDYVYVWGNGAAGGVQSTIPDMARYASALLRKSGGIVRPETFDRMVSRQWSPDPRLPAWGLSFEQRIRFGHPTFGHGGGVIGGWNTYLCVYPEDNLATLVHTNIMYEKFDTAIMPAIQQAVLGVTTEPLPDLPLSPAVTESAPGVYEAATPGPLTNFRVMIGCGRVQISIRDSGLVLHSRRGPWKAGVPMRPADPAEPDLFLLDTGDPQPPRIAAILDADGRVTAWRFPQFVVMHCTDRVQPWT